MFKVSRGCRLLLWFLLAWLATSSLVAEIPLPSAIVYGEIFSEEELVGVVKRDDEVVLEVPAEFVEYEGRRYFVLRIPMETKLGIPGPEGEAAQDGDVLESILRDGQPISGPDSPLVLAPATIDELPPTDERALFVRGDSDSSGKVDISDGLVTLLFLFQGQDRPACEDAADSDDTGRLDISDAVRIFQWLFVGPETLPMPPSPTSPDYAFADCGHDPTPGDALGCEREAPVCLDGAGGAEDAPLKKTGQAGGGGGAAGPAFLTFQGRPELPGPSPFAGAAVGPGPAVPWRPRADGARNLNTVLDISPPLVSFGDARFVSQARTISLHNRSETPLHLALDSSDEAFAVHPGRLELPPRGSMIAFVEWAQPDFPEGASVASIHEAEIQVAAEGFSAGRIPVEAENRDVHLNVRLDVVHVGREASEPIAMPVTLSGDTQPGALSLRFLADPGVFRGVEFLPASGVLIPDRTSARAGELVLEIEMHEELDTGGPRPLGHLILIPEAALGAGTYPVDLEVKEATAPDGTVLEASATHGEICCQEAWLDLDGDGEVLASYEPVLAYRFFSGEEELWPAGWGAPRLEEYVVAKMLEARASTIDVDNSGQVDTSDLRAIMAGLSGFDVFSKDVDARIRNLHIPHIPAATAAAGEREVASELETGDLQSETAETLELGGCFTADESLELALGLSPESIAAANHLDLAVTFPEGLFSLQEHRLSVEESEAETGLLLEDRSEEGFLRALVYEPGGGPLGVGIVAGRLLELTLAPREPQAAPLGDIRALVTAAFQGARPVTCEGGVLPLPNANLEPCAEGGVGCDDIEANLGAAQIVEALEHLFLGTPEPHCPHLYDRDGDGALQLQDVSLLIREVTGR